MSVIRDHLATHANALTLREQRNNIIASNIANAATPGFRARDFDFTSALQQQMGTGSMDRSHNAHFATGTPGQMQLGYRQPINPSLDGNTVESAVEQMEFAENSVRYQTSLMFLNRRISGLARAIRGE